MLDGKREKKLMKAKKALSRKLNKWSQRHNMTDAEVLAVLAFMVGAAIALQDQGTMTKERALDIVTKNIEIGNQSALSEILNTKGSA